MKQTNNPTHIYTYLTLTLPIPSITRTSFFSLLESLHIKVFIDSISRESFRSYLHSLSFTSPQVAALEKFCLDYEFGLYSKSNDFASPHNFYEYFCQLS